MAKTILVTGANGHLAHGLIPLLKGVGHNIIALDIEELDEELGKEVDEKITGNILEPETLKTIFEKGIDTVFHMASTLALSGELDPLEAHETNATGTVNLLHASLLASSKSNKPIQFIFPSSIAVYNLPDREARNGVVVTEDDAIGNPQTIYGITKSYCESLGSYYADRYELLSETAPGQVDFRAVRLPGIIATVEGSETMGKYAGLTMIHSPAEGGGFEMYIKPDTVLPFITRMDAVKALIALSDAPKEKLTRRVYNVSGFTASIKELEQLIGKAFPDAQASENFDVKRQAIVDTWPQAVDDAKAREDWGWNPSFNNIQSLT